MLQKSAVGCLWVFVIVMIPTVIFVFSNDWWAGIRLTLLTLLVAGGISSFIFSLKRRQELAQEAAASPQPRPGAKGVPSGQPVRIWCRSQRRGKGELHVDEEGNLHFVGIGHPKRTDIAPLYDTNLGRASAWRIARRLFRGIFRRPMLHRLPQELRSIRIERRRLRAAAPFDRILWGPSIMVSYEVHDGSVEWEEFLLSIQDAGMTFPQPTADPNAIIKSLGFGEQDTEMLYEAGRERSRAHRQFGLGMSLFLSTCVAALVVPMTILVALTAGDAEAARLALGLGVLMWLGASLFIGLLVLAISR